MDINNVTIPELEQIKQSDIELYLILRYGSLHEGFLVWQSLFIENRADTSREAFFKFLDSMISYQDRMRNI